MFCKRKVCVKYLNVPKLICLYTVKCFQILLSFTNNHIQY